MSIPDGWSSPLMIDLFNRLSGGGSDSKILVGPNGKYLQVLMTPLSEDEPEPTIDETEEYFDGLAYRQSLHVVATGTIRVANKEHFWATYYRMKLIRVSQIQFFKKYCLYLNRIEYLLTAGLHFASAGQKLPTDDMIRDSEGVYDEIVLSFKPLSD